MKGDVINETGELSMLPHYFMGMNKKLFLGPAGASAAAGAAAAIAVAAEWSLSVVGWLSHAGGASFFAAMRACAGSLLGSLLLLLLPRLFVLVMPMLLLQLRLEKKLLQYMDLINSPGGYLDVVLKRKFARGSDQRLL
jgi:hypothetical protein